MNITNKIHQAKYFVRHCLLAVDQHSIQPPFAYKFYTDIIRNNNKSSVFKQINKVRKQLLRNTSSVTVNDFGAGSQHDNGKQRKIGKIAKVGVSSKKASQLLYRIIENYKCDTILELGTSLGINTLYLAKANTKGMVYTLEGSDDLVKEAKNLFKAQLLDNISVVKGNIDVTLPEILSQIDTVDFAYLDANHTYKATLRYFKLIENHSSENTVIIIDDIYWSPDMTRAWREIRTSDAVRLSFDLFDMGILFFKKGLVKQHYIVRH